MDWGSLLRRLSVQRPQPCPSSGGGCLWRPSGAKHHLFRTARQLPALWTAGTPVRRSPAAKDGDLPGSDSALCGVPGGNRPASPADFAGGTHLCRCLAGGDDVSGGCAGRCLPPDQAAGRRNQRAGGGGVHRTCRRKKHVL